VAALWQQAMIRIARTERVVDLVQRRELLAGLAGRFVAGPDVESAIAQARRLRSRGIAVTAFWLGEYVHDEALVAQALQQLQGVVGALAGEGLDVHASVDPTQAGLLTSAQQLERNLTALAHCVDGARRSGPRRGRDVLMIDMEDSATTQATLDLHARLQALGLPVAVTVQAYLHRSDADLRRLAASGAWVRLVKGALAEPPEVAADRRADIDARYRQGLATLFSPQAREAGCRPSVATHDLRMIVAATELARRHGWRASDFELEMLHGVRPDLQEALAGKGFRVRAYLPFGQAWFPYAVRRVGESPRNLRFAATALTRARARG
jgi:proline dehydrogenase